MADKYTIYQRLSNVIFLFIILLFILACSTVKFVKNQNADFKNIKRIAVLPFITGQGIDEIQGKVLADRFAADLISVGYDVVERAQIEHVIKEMNLQMTGLIDPKGISELGRIFGIQGLVLGKHYNISGSIDNVTQIKLISVETGSVLWIMESLYFNRFIDELKQHPEVLP